MPISVSTRATRVAAATLSLLLASATTSQPVSFSPPELYTVFSNAYDVAIGDFNNDGIPDLITANHEGRAATVLLGDGDGTFQLDDIYFLGSPTSDNLVTSVAVGDVNNDGNLDAVLAGRTTRIFTLYGAGDGTFSTIVESTPAIVDGIVSEAILHDFENGGALNLVLVTDTRQTFLYEQAGGLWDTDEIRDFGPGPLLRAGIALGEYGGNDGFLELMVSPTTDSWPVGFNVGALPLEYFTFTVPGLLPASDIVGTDFNSDGISDFAAAVPGNSVRAQVLVWDDVTFAYVIQPVQGAASMGDELWGIEAPDLNNDGNPDLVVTEQNQGIGIAYGNGDGTFSDMEPYSTGLATGTHGLAIADLDGDGWPDVVTTDGFSTSGTDQLSVLLSNGEGLPPLNLAVQENIAISDVPRLLPELLLAVAEAVGVSDLPTLSPALLLAVQESIAVSDDPSLIPPLLLAVQETIAVSDDPSLIPPLMLAVQESISVDDSPNLAPALLLVVAEAIGVTDNPLLSGPLMLFVQEAIAVSDDPALAAALLLQVQETIAVGDVVGTLLGVEGLITSMEGDIIDLVASEVLTRRQAQGLLKKLDQIRRKVDRGQYSVALNILGAFVNQVELYRTDGILSEEQADGLLNQALALATAIEQLMQGENLVAKDLPMADVSGLPDAYSLGQAYPNPFSRSTTITYALPEDVHVRIEVYDMLGRTVAVLVDQTQRAGRYAASFNGNDRASGSYIYRITAGSFTGTRTMLLVR